MGTTLPQDDFMSLSFSLGKCLEFSEHLTMGKARKPIALFMDSTLDAERTGNG